MKKRRSKRKKHESGHKKERKSVDISIKLKYRVKSPFSFSGNTRLYKSVFDIQSNNYESKKNEENYEFFYFEHSGYKRQLTIIVMLEKFTFQSSFLFLFDQKFIEHRDLVKEFNRIISGIERFAIINSQLNGFIKIKGFFFLLINFCRRMDCKLSGDP